MNVFKPTCVMHPGRFAAISRSSWQMTPCGKIVRLDLFFDGQSSQVRDQAPMTTNYSTNEAFVREMIQTSCCSIALSCSKNESQIARMSALLKPTFDRRGQAFRMSGSDEAAAGYRSPVFDEQGRFLSRTQFVLQPTGHLSHHSVIDAAPRNSSVSIRRRFATDYRHEVSAVSRLRCWPVSSKLDGSSHCSNACCNRGQSLSMMAYQAVSRLRPLLMRA